MLLSLYKMDGEPYHVVETRDDKWSTIENVMNWYYGTTQATITFSETLPNVAYIIPLNSYRPALPSEFNTQWVLVTKD